MRHFNTALVDIEKIFTSLTKPKIKKPIYQIFAFAIVPNEKRRKV